MQGTDTQSPSLHDEARQLFTAVSQLSHAEKQKWALRSELVSQEWHLSQRAFTVAFCLSLSMVVVGSGIWVMVNGLVFTLMLDAGVRTWATILIILLSNLLLVMYLWRNLKRSMRRIGFSRSWASITGGEASNDN